MPGRSKILKVPYFTQPTENTCQSTVLKMFASYIEKEVLRSDGGALSLKPTDIYATINGDSKRPIKGVTNSHENIRWWLSQRFTTLTFPKEISTSRVDEAIDHIVTFIDSGFPVLMSVSHSRVKGHIVLVFGYENHIDFASSADFKLVVHDPYGAFDPSLLSKAYGKQRYQSGMSLLAGGEVGPGTAVRLDPLAASRQRKGDKAFGTYYMISATR